MQEILQDFSRVFDHFVETRCYRVKLKFFDIAFFLAREETSKRISVGMLLLPTGEPLEIRVIGHKKTSGSHRTSPAPNTAVY